MKFKIEFQTQLNIFVGIVSHTGLNTGTDGIPCVVYEISMWLDFLTQRSLDRMAAILPITFLNSFSC